MLWLGCHTTTRVNGVVKMREDACEDALTARVEPRRASAAGGQETNRKGWTYQLGRSYVILAWLPDLSRGRARRICRNLSLACRGARLSVIQTAHRSRRIVARGNLELPCSNEVNTAVMRWYRESGETREPREPGLGSMRVFYYYEDGRPGRLFDWLGRSG